MTDKKITSKPWLAGAGIGAAITALIFSAGIGIYSISTPDDASTTPPPAPSATAPATEESAWSQEQQAMAYYIAADTVSRYLSEYEVTRQWQDSLGHWGTEAFKEKVRYIDPSLNKPGDITAITDSNFAVQNLATVTVESTAGTFTLTLVPEGDEVKVEQLKVN